MDYPGRLSIMRVLMSEAVGYSSEAAEVEVMCPRGKGCQQNLEVGKILP